MALRAGSGPRWKSHPGDRQSSPEIRPGMKFPPQGSSCCNDPLAGRPSLCATAQVGEYPGRQAVDTLEVFVLLILLGGVVAAALPVLAQRIALRESLEARHSVAA